MPAPDYKTPHPLIPTQGLRGREDKPYRAHPDLIAAANAALVLGRPLLLTGEAGCGKTDFAFAAATGLGEHPDAGAETTRALECYVRSDSRARDLLYSYDAIRRFGDAQSGGEEGKARARDPRPYLRLEDLGRALMSPYLRVVLIDEIDKAPRDLPNDLLRELDQGHFEISEIASGDPEPAAAVHPDDAMTFRHTMVRPRADVRPLVIITSNVERQLPDPFLRRCVFFHIPFPETEELQAILGSRFDNEALFLDRVVDVFDTIRNVPMLTKKPSTAELIHWTHSLEELYGPAAVRRTLDQLVGGPERRARGHHGEIRWRDLPLMGCLIKLREDRERLLGVGLQ